jgi:hypothetical protein
LFFFAESPWLALVLLLEESAAEVPKLERLGRLLVQNDFLHCKCVLPRSLAALALRSRQRSAHLHTPFFVGSESIF